MPCTAGPGHSAGAAPTDGECAGVLAGRRRSFIPEPRDPRSAAAAPASERWPPTDPQGAARVRRRGCGAGNREHLQARGQAVTSRRPVVPAAARTSGSSTPPRPSSSTVSTWWPARVNASATRCGMLSSSLTFTRQRGAAQAPPGPRQHRRRPRRRPPRRSGSDTQPQSGPPASRPPGSPRSRSPERAYP